MAFFDRHRKSNPGDIEFLNYKVTWEAFDDIPDDLAPVMEKLYNDAKKKKKGIIEKLKGYIKKYPHQPTLKNYLYIAYKMHGKNAEATEVLEYTLRKHPDYLFGKINFAASYLGTENLHRVPEILGEYMDIKMLAPEREVFHFSEVFSFAKVAAIYFIEKGDLESAAIRLDIMKQLAPGHQDIEMVEHKMTLRRLELLKASYKKSTISVESFPTVDFEKSTTIPQLENEILHQLYRYSIQTIPESLIKEILELPRESLIADLENILLDAVRRFDWYQDIYEEFDPEEQEFPVHALYFLTELKATESLDTMLNVLRQGEDLLDYWFSDQLVDFWEEPLYLLANQQLEQLKAFALEPNVFYFARVLVTKVVEQIALHQPERKTEVINWFREVLQYHIDHSSTPGIIDTEFLTLALESIIIIRAKELLPVISNLYAKGWINESDMGKISDIEQEINEPLEPSDKDAMPENIYDHYSSKYLDNENYDDDDDVSFSDEELEIFEELRKAGKLDSLLKDLPKNFFGISDDENYDEYKKVSSQHLGFQEPNIRRGPKVGRNDPCPCGSGKKYKHCCFNK